ncbi:MAG: nucleotidyl transferase AbiEii/AbiGii toxin family protein [Planctomycetaceae bacterium]|nr:MAG: nucleotidyl transferase AbiEii/AbiGii toxin family protein [Planctomycetaceae bacterium]
MKKHPSDNDIQRLDRIKKLVVIAVFSDDQLMERLVLKGGNALDIVHRISTRASIDVDLSMADEFTAAERLVVRDKLEHVLKQTFRPAGYEVFDVKMEDKPPALTPDMADFWGGYCVEFKLAERSVFDKFSTDVQQLRRNALPLGQSSKFLIDISKFEYTTGKQPKNLDGYRIFVYSPEMIVAEKLRAICQQMPEYGPVIKRSRAGTSRARDFLDILTLVTTRDINMDTRDNRSLLSHIFTAKKVPLALIGLIGKYREFHQMDFHAVKDTVRPGVILKDFNFYFDFVLDLAQRLKSLWNV